MYDAHRVGERPVAVVGGNQVEEILVQQLLPALAPVKRGRPAVAKADSAFEVHQNDGVRRHLNEASVALFAFFEGLFGVHALRNVGEQGGHVVVAVLAHAEVTDVHPLPVRQLDHSFREGGRQP